MTIVLQQTGFSKQRDRAFRVTLCKLTMDNVYAQSDYAEGYATLDWQGTYYLLLRDLPAIVRSHVQGTRALDFGCGAGRSTRLLRSLGFETIGIDVSAAMVDQARKLDPGHDYRVISDGDFEEFQGEPFDVVLSCFPFDNIPGADHKTKLLSGLKTLLAPHGVLVNIVSNSEIYRYEWATFTTAPFPENRSAQNEDIVQIITKDFADQPVCNDVFCDDEGYREMYQAAGLSVVAEYRPLGTNEDPVAWVSETEVAPWVVWVLRAT